MKRLRSRLSGLRYNIRESFSNGLSKTSKDETFEESSSGYFLVTHNENLRHYLNRGIFYPIRAEINPVYRENRIADFFDWNPNYLTLVGSKVYEVSSDEVFIEVFLTEEEDKSCRLINNGIYSYSLPLPVSRIKAIYFSNDKKLSDYLAVPFSVSIVPESKFFVENRVMDLPDLERIEERVDTENNLKNLRRYDSLMGALSFTKTMGLFSSSDTDERISLSSESILCLDFLLNSAIESSDEDKFNFSKLKSRKGNRAVIELFFGIIADSKLEGISETFSDTLKLLDERYIQTGAELNDFEQFISEMIDAKDQKKSYTDGLRDILHLYYEYKKQAISTTDLLNNEIFEKEDFKGWLYALLIHIYYRKRMEDREQVRNVLLRQERPLIGHRKLFFSLLILGYYYGYSLTQSHEDTELPLPIKELFKTADSSLKFSLENRVEKLFYEAAYQYIFVNDFKPSISPLKTFGIEPPILFRQESLDCLDEKPSVDRLYYQILKLDDLEIRRVIIKSLLEESFEEALRLYRRVKYSMDFSEFDYLKIWFEKYFRSSDTSLMLGEGNPGQPLIPFDNPIRKNKPEDLEKLLEANDGTINSIMLEELISVLKLDLNNFSR